MKAGIVGLVVLAMLAVTGSARAVVYNSNGTCDEKNPNKAGYYWELTTIHGPSNCGAEGQGTSTYLTGFSKDPNYQYWKTASGGALDFINNCYNGSNCPGGTIQAAGAINDIIGTLQSGPANAICYLQFGGTSIGGSLWFGDNYDRCDVVSNPTDGIILGFFPSGNCPSDLVNSNLYYATVHFDTAVGGQYPQYNNDYIFIQPQNPGTGLQINGTLACGENPQPPPSFKCVGNKC